VLERSTGEVSWLAASDCAFGYRTSRFKREPERFIVLSVRFRLRPQGAPSVRYAELLRALPADPAPTLREVSSTVRALRAKKSMLLDPHDPNGKSAGSFFTNPVVSEADAERVRRIALERGMVASASDVPSFAAGPGEVKLAAGWLIEKSGISKGFTRDGVGVSSAHALCLVHRGGGSTRALMALAAEVIAAVQRVFAVNLEPEPVLWGEP
jgi:UDP-N-acetylmuramate dehydrogenase